MCATHLPPSPQVPHGLRAVVVDEWALFRQGVVSVLAAGGVEVVGQASTVADALLRLWSLHPGLLVAGSPAHGRVADLVTQAKGAHPELRVLVLLPVSEAEELRPVLMAGADAVLSRTAGPEELDDAVRRLAAGERVLAAAAVLTGLVAGVAPSARHGHGLTAKELEVLGLLARGLSNREIAGSLVVSEATVKSHLARIYSKLATSGRREAVRRAVELGILS